MEWSQNVILFSSIFFISLFKGEWSEQFWQDSPSCGVRCLRQSSLLRLFRWTISKCLSHILLLYSTASSLSSLSFERLMSMSTSIESNVIKLKNNFTFLSLVIKQWWLLLERTLKFQRPTICFHLLYLPTDGSLISFKVSNLVEQIMLTGF